MLQATILDYKAILGRGQPIKDQEVWCDPNHVINNTNNLAKQILELAMS